MTDPKPGEVWRRPRTEENKLRMRVVRIVSIGDDGIVAVGDDVKLKSQYGRRVLISREAWVADGWERVPT